MTSNKHSSTSPSVATNNTMNNILTLGEYHAKIEYDPELDLFRGDILGLNGGADFYASNPTELRLEFKKSLDVFLEVCKEQGIAPRKQYSGKFNIRIAPQLHEQLALTAQSRGTSINALAQEALQECVAA
jgi:predicted HicB family RNase H-like nuclease